MIKISSLNKYFNRSRENEIHVINDVSLELPERGMVAIFGKSGCGKTTLLNVLGGLDGFSSGSVEIDGEDISGDTDRIRNKYIGYVFQNYNLNSAESCFENVADALRLCGMKDEGEITERVNTALKCVGMEKYGKRLPDTLSGGQQQRIAIARAIVKNPRIVLADEPTGNLDEANTVMIMNLLKAISREHLVIIVTHEANLVDYYCDRVIELSDGKVVSERTNDNADGYVAKDKNDIYLGELDSSRISTEAAEIDYYGDKPEIPLKLTLVNKGGVMYLRVDGGHVRVLADTSEITLREGRFECKSTKSTDDTEMNIPSLPTVEAESTGRLFSFRSSLKSGFRANFKKKKRSARVLVASLCLFSIVTVMMTAVFGKSIEKLVLANDAYNHNVFYVYTDSAEISEKLNSAVGGEESGIDYLTLISPYGEMPCQDDTLEFDIRLFETYVNYTLTTAYSTNAVYLGMDAIGDAGLLAGNREGLSDMEMLISRKVADKLLEGSVLGYITEYKDLIGLISTYGYSGKTLRIAGVVDTYESAVYLSDMAMAKRLEYDHPTSNATPASEKGVKIESGKCVLVLQGEKHEDCPKVNDTVKIQGKSFEVVEILTQYNPHEYGRWILENGMSSLSREEYIEELVKTEYPELSYQSDEFYSKYDELYGERYFDYYDVYYAKLDSFLNECYLATSTPDFALWLSAVKGIDDAKYAYVNSDYYEAILYKEEHGRYPTLLEYEENRKDFVLYYGLDEYEKLYYEEYMRSQQYSSKTYSYLVSDSDYVELSKRIGETHTTAQSTYANEYYTVLHSTDVEKTEEWLLREIGYLPDSDYGKGIATPDDVFDYVLRDTREEIIGGAVTILVILAVMSACMFFIMRSSLMSRIKEIGIYRAVGVSKKNLIFRFFVESLCVSSLTLLLGFVLACAFIYACFAVSPLSENMFYFPVWLMGFDLALLVALGVVCGTLPIINLLKKTPSEILAKYDI